MKQYKIVIEELVVEEFDVEADNSDEAIIIAKEKYRDAEFVISPGEPQYKQMAIVSPVTEISKWIEF